VGCRMIIAETSPGIAGAFIRKTTQSRAAEIGNQV
jgi:hypothetical protein